MQDGLYRVTTEYLCAGFVVENGDVTDCAPILRRKLDYWKTVAVRLSPSFQDILDSIPERELLGAFPSGRV